MAQLAQNKRGYIRGVRGLVITGLNSDGTMPVSPTRYGIKTAQEVSVEAEVVGGKAGELRGGDKVLAYVKDPDTVVGVNLGVKDARFDARALVLIGGGTLIEVVEDEDTRITGWEAPTIEDQQAPPVFQVELYAQSHGSRGELEGYLLYTFAFARGRVGNVTHSDAEWSTPELALWCAENPSTSGGVYRKEFVAALPAELQ